MKNLTYEKSVKIAEAPLFIDCIPTVDYSIVFCALSHDYYSTN